MPAIIAIFVALAAICLVVIGVSDTRERDEFMHECVKDHKQYECTAMWRAGEDHTQVVPVVVPMPR